MPYTSPSVIAFRKNSSATVGTRPRLNLIEGNNVTLTVTDDNVDDEVDVTIAAAGGGGGSATTIEQNLSATATWRGRFTITDAAITATSKVLCWQAPGPYTGKGTRVDEAEMQSVSVVCVAPATGSAVVTWETPPMLTQTAVVAGGRRNAPAANQHVHYDDTVTPRRLGKVRGNVKFSYTILS